MIFLEILYNPRNPFRESKILTSQIIICTKVYRMYLYVPLAENHNVRAPFLPGREDVDPGSLPRARWVGGIPAPADPDGMAGPGRLFNSFRIICGIFPGILGDFGIRLMLAVKLLGPFIQESFSNTLLNNFLGLNF